MHELVYFAAVTLIVLDTFMYVDLCLYDELGNWPLFFVSTDTNVTDNWDRMEEEERKGDTEGK